MEERESYTDIEFGDCEPEHNPFDRYRIAKKRNNLVIQELKGDPAKETWTTVSYHGTSLNSLLAGVFNVIIAQHYPQDVKLPEQLENLRLELISSVDKVAKMIKEADID